MSAISTDRTIRTCTDRTSALEGFTENARKVLRARYLKKNEKGECIESIADLFRRVARTIADVEIRYGATPAERDEIEECFYDLIVSRRFMPNSPTLMNAGREMGMLSACFVLPVRDSIDAIFDSIKHTALIQKAGGGTGFAFDELRPTGDFIKSSGGTTSGPISFWRAFSEATNAIQQGAFRRGANMGMMNIHHPDILKFLFAKQDLTQFTNYNISVKVTDEWMEGFTAAPAAPHVVRNPRTGKTSVLPRDLSIATYTVADLIPWPSEAADSTPVYSRQDIWDIIVKHAWQTGEPGVVFIDRINEHNPTPHVGRIEATNPCGEQPLLPYEACNLGSINLGVFVQNPHTPQAEVDWNALRDAVHESTRFLDNVIDANNYPLPEIDGICKANRKIGLGVMGFADALYMLGVRYNSEDGIAWGERFMKFVNDEAHNASEELARQRGNFSNWQGSIWDTRHHRPMRNAAVTTVAPTGTISIIANCSGGVEPMFSLAFYRNVLVGQAEGKTPLIEINDSFSRVGREQGFYSEGLMDQVARDGTLAHLPGIPEDVRRVFVCAHDIEPDWHVRMQAAFQRHCDASISKTINFSHDADPRDVEEIYKLAYSLDCKGVTVYRDACRSSQPMALADSQSRHAESSTIAASSDAEGRTASTEVPMIHTERNLFGERITHVEPRPTLEPQPLPAIVSGLRIRQLTPFGNMHVNITVDAKQQRELEVFAQLGKGGDLANSDLEAICRMISLWLRAGGDLGQVIKQLSGIGSSLQIPTRTGRIMSLGDGLAQALKRYQRAKERHGLEALLLGDVDPVELDSENPSAAPHNGGNGGNGGHGRAGNEAGRPAAPLRRDSSSSTALKGADGAAAPDQSRFTDGTVTGYKLKCPECGDVLDLGERCKKCHQCGWSQC